MSEVLGKIVSRENIHKPTRAYKQVKSNKGLAGMNEVTIQQIDEYKHWSFLFL